MYVARREDVGADQIICGLAASSDADAPNLLPPGDPASGLVLAVADGTPRNPLSRVEVIDKARDLTAPVLGRDKSEQLIATVFAIETVADVRNLRPLLQPG